MNKSITKKKLIGILFCISLMSNSCDTDCNDCGPTGYTRYYMLNSTSEPVTITWFGNTTLSSNISHEFIISEGEKVLLYESSLTGTTGQISTPPFGSITPYDSIRLESASNMLAYTKSDCDVTANPLCEENYELIKSVDTKNQKIKGWQFEIE